MVYTTAGKAGFITGLYVVLVPLLGLVIGRRTGILGWSGAGLAVMGLYLLSVRDLRIATGDLFVLAGAFFWAVHVLMLGRLSPDADSFELAGAQFAVCALLSLIVSFLFETTTLKGIDDALVPILYGGFLSVGIAYTLQVVGQKKIHPSHAAIILSLEAVFAVLGGWVVLGEELGLRELGGCLLMFAGMLVSQFKRG